jgi:hypothetical protein
MDNQLKTVTTPPKLEEDNTQHMELPRWLDKPTNSLNIQPP